MLERPVRYDIHGCWQVQPAFEGWTPKEPAKLTATGLGLTIIFAALAAWIAAGLTGAFQ